MLKGVLLLVLSGLATGVVGAQRELLVYTWPEYFDPGLLTAFSEEYQVNVREIWYSSDNQKDSDFFLHYRDQIDIVVGAGQLFHPYLKVNALAPLPADLKVPALEPVIAKYHQELLKVALPFTWGTLGVAYRRDLMVAPVERWVDVLRPSAALKGKITMLSESQDLFEIARLTLGLLPDQTSQSDLRAIENLLLAQHPYVNSYQYMDPSKHAGLVSGQVSVAAMYNGDALRLQEWSEQVDFVVPEEGSVLWVDFLVINAQAPNRSAAEDFIRFFARPEVSARNAEYLHFASPFQAASALIADDIRNNPLVYPPAQVMSKLVVPPVPDAELKRFQNTLMMRLVQQLEKD
ncbi:putrescine-binding protein SpuD [Maricurvus nonylphenolicus]|uniref:polyamine ABC transporter substrate-binding protein n=1 Tax=Maricurvus nonylphenolicus TaxID=1008307 RepID=UPI0036F33110